MQAPRMCGGRGTTGTLACKEALLSCVLLVHFVVYRCFCNYFAPRSSKPTLVGNMFVFRNSQELVV